MYETVVLRPQGWCDLRDSSVNQLHYPPGALVLVAGIPGAGKSTLLQRLFALTGSESSPAVVEGVHIADSRQTRRWWAKRFPRLPRPLVRLSHFMRVYRRVRRGIGLVAHTRGTRRQVTRLFAGATRRAGTSLHVVLIDVPAEVALAGQQARGRIIASPTFRSHVQRWSALIKAGAGVLDEQFAGASSVVLLDRATADHLTAIRHTDEGQ